MSMVVVVYIMNEHATATINMKGCTLMIDVEEHEQKRKKKKRKKEKRNKYFELKNSWGAGAPLNSNYLLLLLYCSHPYYMNP